MKILSLALLASLFSLPALADHHLVFISGVVVGDSDECAVELEIAAADQDAFTANDVIMFDDTEVASLATMVDTLNDADGSNDDGDHILFYSEDFELFDDEGDPVLADVEFDSSFCEQLLTASTVNFVINSGESDEEVVDTIDLTEDGEFVGYEKTSSTGTVDILDLTTESITLTKNNGIVTSGGSGSDTDTNVSVSCSLNPAAVQSSVSTWLPVLSGLMAMGMVRLISRR